MRVHGQRGYDIARKEFIMVRNRLTRWGAVVATLALAFVAAMPVAAHAANTSPTNYMLTISASSPTGTTEHTYFRTKADNTVAYAKAEAYSTGVILGVAGINGYSLAVTNRTVNTYAYFRATNQASSIRNTVNESSEAAAWLWIYKTAGAPTSSPTYLQGVWAPDSVALYTVINNGF